MFFWQTSWDIKKFQKNGMEVYNRATKTLMRETPGGSSGQIRTSGHFSPHAVSYSVHIFFFIEYEVKKQRWRNIVF